MLHRYFHPISLFMSTKNHIAPIHFVGNILKVFVTKLMQNPEYYPIKHHLKHKERHKHHNNMW